MDLKQYIKNLFIFFRFFVDFFEEFHSIHTLYKMHERGNRFHLIGLEVTYKMPAYILWQLPCFCNHFLYIIFTEIQLTHFIKSQNFLNRFGLGNSNQNYLISKLSNKFLI